MGLHPNRVSLRAYRQIPWGLLNPVTFNPIYAQRKWGKRKERPRTTGPRYRPSPGNFVQTIGDVFGSFDGDTRDCEKVGFGMQIAELRFIRFFLFRPLVVVVSSDRISRS